MGMQVLTMLTTYVLIILCELGDKTQVAVLLITSNNPARRWLVFGASFLALSLCVLIEVTAGVTLAKYIAPAQFNRITGVIFLAIGVFTLFQHFRPGEKMVFNKSRRTKEMLESCEG
ncbi:MAG: TMEM165/GDT1 family protein [Syntrophomonadaceae bacterium]|nr:TMEM165/GDT1 family protein [Syntrophomonadaceae bacterium]